MWWAGRSMRMRRAYMAELEARARRLERARDAHARAALAEERARIARELHDVIAHHVSVMTVQAAAAQRVLGSRPEEAREALTAITETGRSALAEMRNLVVVLRTDDDGPPPAPGRAPQPGVAQLETLAGQLREAGLAVRLTTEGEPAPLPPGVDLTVYRVVQEALTNTLKHGGPETTAEVLLRYEPRALHVSVRDDGRGAPATTRDDPDRPGHGILGMRERVSLYGGELRAGPGRAGGYRVDARLPRGAG
ncbi:MAG: hypothetical protein GEV11_11935 [Streptosporangiales bacterium]|nr:hypothetical protein [Streptosporangiales bacterium]